MKKLQICLIAIFACLLMPSGGTAAPAQLDRGFGSAGKVAELLGPLPPPGEEFVALAWAGRGTIVAVVADRLVEYLPNGKRNRGFGRNGAVPVPAVTDGASSQLRGLAVDSRERILVAGTESGSVFVSRYLPDGRPDRSFGEAGRVLSDLGLPAPADPPPVPGWSPPADWPTPLLHATGLAVDSLNRPLLTGSWQETYQFCYLNTWNAKSVGFLARFDENGARDPSFDFDGLRLDPRREADYAPAIDGSGVYVIGENPACRRGTSSEPVLTRLSAGGFRTASSGSEGASSFPSSKTPRWPSTPSEEGSSRASWVKARRCWRG